VNVKSSELYDNYESYFDETTKDEFREDIEEIMSTENQKAIARRVFINEVQLYSKFILFFLTAFAILFFFVSFYFITRPLKRLQNATIQLAMGNSSVKVKESRFSPLNDLIISFNDMANELMTNRKRLIQAEKDAAWRDMARVLAHEIKNPLTPMRLSLERLEMKYTLKSKDIDNVFTNVTKIIHEEIDNLQTFATEFSNFAKLPEAVMKHYNINSQIKDICSPYQNEIDLKLKLDNSLPEIYADKVQLKQIFENLIQYSINATFNNCKIEIQTKSDINNLYIYIKDNGMGIEENDLKEIFTPYFTKSRGGTGLGLAIVRRIIENHNGSIDVESEINKGTTFTLSFPIVKHLEN
jgi:nitrogen fixation/metabolism regulation signal transduction histidine kinase